MILRRGDLKPKKNQETSDFLANAMQRARQWNKSVKRAVVEQKIETRQRARVRAIAESKRVLWCEMCRVRKPHRQKRVGRSVLYECSQCRRERSL
jgi:hypothetical protein